MTTKLPFAILVQGDHPPRDIPRPVFDISELSDDDLLGMCEPAGGVLVIDLETQGVESWDLSSHVVGFSVADAEGCCYVHLGINKENQARWRIFLEMLYTEGTPLLAHNQQFDAAWMSRDLSLQLEPDNLTFDNGIVWHVWHGCTLSMYKNLASEGWMGQRHSLKCAMVDVLGWSESNEGELDSWLCDNGYGYYTKHKDGTTSSHPNKAEMWRAPKEILGKYAALDAEATWLLWDKVLRPAWDYFEVYQEYHKTWLAGLHGLQYHHVWQKLRGLSINQVKLATLHTNLERRLVELENEFREHAEVKEHISKFEHDVLAQLMQEKPNMWKKLPELGVEPDKYTKKGPVSQSWTKWEDKRVSIEQLKKDIILYEALEAWTPLTEAQVSHHWKTWKQRFTEAAGSRHFNMRSAEHKRKLFYDAMGYPVLVFTDSETNPQPAVDDEALKGFGEAGRILQTYASVEKLRSTVVSLTEKLDRNGVYHPELRIPGTHTGRLSGAGGFNAQNVAKVKELLECFQARPGYSLVFADIAALEPATLAQRCQDATYLKLYGPAAKPDDVYSHVAAQLGGELGSKIRATGYDPDNPNKEAIAKIKKEAKKERNIAKLLHLSAGYGAGAGKIRVGLAQQGVEMSLNEAKRMHTAYWALFSQVKAFARWLEAMWENNGGWWLNGIGIPQCLAEDYKRDIMNRDIQGTGHCIFTLFTVVLAQALEEQDIWYAPFIWDIHDCVSFECRDEDKEAVQRIVDVDVVQRVNAILGAGYVDAVKLKWDANIVKTWAEDKTEAISVDIWGV